MARWKAYLYRRPLAEAPDLVERDEGHGTGGKRAGLFHHSRQGAGKPKLTGTQGQGSQGLDSMLFGGYSKALRP